MSGKIDRFLITSVVDPFHFDKDVFTENFFLWHCFGYFLALPGSGSVSFETDPDPAK